MFYVEFAKEEANIDFDGGFEFEYLEGGRIKITPYSPDGEVIKVSKNLYRQMCNFARAQLPGLQAMVSDMIVESKW